MEDKITSCGQDGNKCQLSGLKLFWNESIDSERCDSIELNTLIRRQIQQKKINKEEEGVSRQQILYQSSLCTHKCFIQSRKQNNMSREEYENRIQILEKQRAELLEVNKQWDQHFRHMKLTYENKVAELNVKLSLCQHNTGPEQSLQKKRDECSDQDKDIKQALLKATRKEKFELETTSLNSPAKNTDYEDLRTKVEVLIQQIQIYEEDFKQEKADRERITKEKEELQQINQRLRFQLRINSKPDYQWYVPGQLPPDVKQKKTGAPLKQCHMPQ
ncbi:TNFAIP3-interacting protein 3 [Mixophyes fleayi]|uniref:TNFAIP3-interacting protein 3 n=1 Tax=Mixophyes fleayi TaxID=3061075 RepID=UPI003F4D7CEC